MRHKMRSKRLLKMPQSDFRRQLLLILLVGISLHDKHLPNCCLARTEQMGAQVAVDLIAKQPATGPISSPISNTDSPSSQQEHQQQNQVANISDQADNFQLDASPLSARGSLAFWRQLAASVSTSATPTNLDQQASSSSSQAAPQSDSSEHQKRAFGSQQQRRSNENNNTNRCQLKTSTKSIRPTSLINKLPQTLSNGISHWQMVAVEGKSLQVNFLLVLSGSKLSGENPAESLSIGWLRNNRPLDVQSHRSAASQSGSSRFSHQIVSGPESLASIETDHHHESHGAADEWQQFQTFMLANYLNEPLLSRLQSSAIAQQQTGTMHVNTLIQDLSKLKTSVSNWAEIRNEPDYFVGAANDPSSIDWARAYAQFEHQNGHLSTSNCKNENQHQQLALIRLTMNQLEVEDSGSYQLRVCSNNQPTKQETFSNIKPADKRNQNNNLCQNVHFQLLIAPDIPKLETWLEPELLESGSRFSIKCQASGFTLPQISWFLDNQLISEHQTSQHQQVSSRQQQQQQQIQPIAISSRFRIGDYVSQDNQVHSFINATHLLATDGGFYKCRANNGLHQLESVARIDVRGLVSVSRPLPNASTLVGTPELQFQCPYSGYPISNIEWYFKAEAQSASERKFRARRLVARKSGHEESAKIAGYEQDESMANADPQQQDPDTDLQEDEWLSQAQALTTLEPSDYPPEPDSWPDYPPSGLIPARQNNNPLSDYVDLDYRSESASLRTRRDLASQPVELDVANSQWIQFPHSRRHHIYPNGTLVLQSVSRDDQGLYKCRVLGPQQAPNEPNVMQQNGDFPHFSSWSNAFHLTVQVAPVISPFASSESLREGMRNFLTCSVIEGDAPIKLSWLKDGAPIDQYIGSFAMQTDSEAHGSNYIAENSRIRVETNNEFTSTLFFQHVEFKDNGNYTCIATNKAASVNYTARMLVNVPPKWLRAPKDIECIAGQNIIIDCQAQAYPNPRVWWEIGSYSSPQATASNSQTPLETGKTHQQHHVLAPNHYRTIISNSRTHILENASLVIRDVNRLDSGHYLCQAANNFGSLSALIKLTVNVGATFAQKYAIKYVKLNENVELDCDPLGQSPIEIIWFQRHHKQLISNLTINNNNNNYKQARSQHQTINQLASGPKLLDLQHQPDATPTPFGRRLFMGSVRTSDLGTQGHAQPAGGDRGGAGWAPEMATQAQSQKLVELDSSMAFELIRGAKSRQENEIVRMLIKQVKRWHSADYICQASNRFGTDEKLIRLFVQEPPDPVSEVSFVRLESRSISLAWTAPYSGNLPITSYTIEWRPISSQSTLPNAIESVPTTPAHLNEFQAQSEAARWFEMTSQSASCTIGNLSPKTSYQIRIRAHNSVGISPLPMQHPLSSTQASFVHTTSEEAPSAPPSDVRAFPLSSSSIQVSWLAPTYMSQQDNLEQQHQQQRKRAHKASITGYMVGYRQANNTNATLIYKTVSLENYNQIGEPNWDQDQQQQLVAHNTSGTRLPLRVIVSELKRNTAYAFHVQAINSAGSGPQSDPVEAKTLLNDPPQAPVLRVSQSTYSSIELQWSFPTPAAPDESLLNLQESRFASVQVEQPTTPVHGYRLYYRIATELNPSNSWAERQLTPETHALVQSNLADQRNEWSLVELTSSKSDATNLTRAVGKQISSPQGWPNEGASGANIRYVLDQLSCGTSYQAYLIAYNSIGTGAPSQIVRARTRGSSPIAPRKPKEFITVNSSSVLLNLDAWQDTGCAISNFEIRYRVLRGGRNEIVSQQSQATATNRHQQNALSQTSWLLLSNNISPEQRQVELRDLEPETWYALLAAGQSSAGKSEQEYRFMTLDKFGHLPAEAMEPPGSPFPAFFQSGANSTGTLRNLLTNFSPPTNQLAQSLLLSGSMLLIVFITCLLFQMRHRLSANSSPASARPTTTTSHNEHKDNASIDSTITGVTNYTSSDNSKNGNVNSHNHCTMPFYKANGAHAGNLANSNNKQFALHLHRDSPYSKFDTLDQVNGQIFANLSQQIEQDPSATDQQITYNNQILENIIPVELQNGIGLANKFNTLSRNELVQMTSDQCTNNNRFRTMQHRPVSTFTPPNAVHSRQFVSFCNNNNNAKLNSNNNEQQQQIYSKLRLMYNGNNIDNLNSTPEHQANNLINQVADNNSQEQQPILFQNQDSMNLSLLGQQEIANGKNLTLRQQLYNSLQQNTSGDQSMQTQPITTELVESLILQQNNRNNANNSNNDSAASQFAPFLIDCQQYTNNQQVQTNNNNDLNQQNDQLLNAPSYGMVAAQSLSSAASTSNGSQSNHLIATPISQISSSMNSSNNQHLSDHHQQQQQAKIMMQTNNTNINNFNNQQQQPTTAPNGLNNEQSDYALPFPPKWV